MSKYIKNFKELASTEARKNALEIVSAGYESIDTENVIKKQVWIEQEILHIDGQKFDLNKYEKIYILGCGKVACSAAFYLERILKAYVDEGAVVGISEGVCEIVETFKGTHPLPSEANFQASKRMQEIGAKATENDLVFVIVGGGGSALLCGSSVEHKQGERLYNKFLKSGGDISELNTVRKHISDLKGGGLAKALYPATVVGLIFSDIPGDDYPDVASGPTYIDETTIEDAQKIIEKYSLGEFDLIETPKDKKFFEKVNNIVLVSNNVALKAMKEKAEALGYDSLIVANNLYGDPKETAKFLIEKSKPGRVVLAGGEISLTIPEGCDGKGGRNDYLAMEMLDHIKKGDVFVSFASDGHDNTDSAGAIIDFDTKNDLELKEVKIEKHKVCLDSYTLFEYTNNLIFTGDLESNVSDLMILLSEK
ncbi:hypothetical protein COW81_01445 [Candidatus Campbellbacteria bacterium CG22_combo_CG10-13_8_21_14_all_36_13]|uniref:Glycerate kinase n=1 Tax=Candidatus Campbellbacteria bacterium CG22_combo_CG10-13_8_21_14_all_36_13 TaxID=1974529 RepID=A0A2H0DYG4_9BACT|nr:MAG: hypothetical protein COW81_01445 [Candidatus Campbellbacteria bacterium CG22_combo_CG10-13_8_21_14_all_36_13]